MIPGEILTAEGDITLNAGAPVTVLQVANTGDRPVQVGSHYHFAETNGALAFDRDAARGQRLDIPAGLLVDEADDNAKRRGVVYVALLAFLHRVLWIVEIDSIIDKL